VLAAGLTLCGSKCSFGADKIKITHLGFEYSSTGVAPSPGKTKAVSDRPIQRSTKEI